MGSTPRAHESRRRRQLKKSFDDLLRDATGDSSAMMRYTDRWHYTNRYCAVVEGLPLPSLQACGSPSCPGVGRYQLTKVLHSRIEKGEITIRVLSEDEFDTRRVDAIRNKTYIPFVKKRRADMGQPRECRKERLFTTIPPVTTELVEAGMEDGEYRYPQRVHPKRESNVLKRRREAKAGDAQRKRRSVDNGAQASQRKRVARA